MSDSQNYIEYIIKMHEILPTNPPIHTYINRINKRLVFKIKDGYKLVLKTPKTIRKTKNGENVPNLEVVEVISVAEINLVHNQCQGKSEVLYTFTPNKFYAYLLNVEQSNLIFLKTHNTEFDKIIITFTNQNSRPFEKEVKVNLTLLINKFKLHIILKSRKPENMYKNINFCHSQEIYLTNMEKILDTATKTGLDAPKTASIKGSP